MCIFFKYLRLLCARILNDFSNGLFCQMSCDKYCIETVYNRILVSCDALIWICASISGHISDMETYVARAWVDSIAS